MELIDIYISNPNFITGIELADYYLNNKAYSSAVSYYLEVVDLAKDIAPGAEAEALVKAAYCYYSLGNRNKTAEHLLLNALTIKPYREAYTLLSRIYELRNQWHLSYYFADAGLSTRLAIYSIPGINYLSNKFQKGVASWWVGKTEQAREIMYDIYSSDSYYKDNAYQNLRTIGFPERVFQSNKDSTFVHNPPKPIKRNYAQSAQDLFVLAALKYKEQGEYLEVGSGDPLRFNNTYLLEKDFGWKGLSIDINPQSVSKFNYFREQRAICVDALKLDYDNINVSRSLDYLQVDCEPPETSFQILTKIIRAGYRPKVITFEHDAYAHGDEIKNASREFLTSKGYTLVVGDVMFEYQNSNYEDWWVLASVDISHMFVTSNILGIDYLTKK